MARSSPTALALGLVAGVAALAAVGAGGESAPADPSRAGASQTPGFAEPTIHAGPEGRLLLGGRWRYASDPGNRGLSRRWHRRDFRTRTVKLPYSPNAGRITGARGARNFEGSVGWYRRAVRVPRSGRYAIRFESVHHRAAVWLDGKLVARHVGAYEPFEVRPVLRARRSHELTVRADWRFPVEQKRQGWHRGWFNYGGINREVSIRSIGPSELDELNLQTDLVESETEGGGRDAVATIAVRVHNHLRSRTVGVRGTLARAGEEIELDLGRERLPAGGTRVFRTRVRVTQPALWSTTDPNLYELRLEVPGESAYRARVGLRELEWGGGRALLNGRPVFLRGASLHEDVPGRGDALVESDHARIVEMLKSVGANATRAQHPLHPALLERLDAAGILLWQEIGPWDSPGNWLSLMTSSLRRRGLRRVMTTLHTDQFHPSIFTWNLGNEVAGNGHPGQVTFVDRAARLLHAEDPGRPVALDVWGILLPPRRPGRMYRNIDAIGSTNYIGWYEFPFADSREIARRIRRRIAYLQGIFPDKFIAATEFGAEGNRRNGRMRHGSTGYQARLLRTHLRTYREIPGLGGMLVWNLRDFGVNPAFAGGSIIRKVRRIRLRPGLNEKGLFDHGGSPKPAARVAREEFQADARERGE